MYAWFVADFQVDGFLLRHIWKEPEYGDTSTVVKRRAREDGGRVVAVVREKPRKRRVQGIGGIVRQVPELG